MALTAQQVQQFYIGYYGRPADPVGLAYWQTQDEATALKGFSESAEFTNQFTGLSASQQVTKVYGNLLGRAPDAPGLLYWAGELTAGRETIGSLVLSMLKNALGKDVTTIEDRVTYSTSFTAALNTAEEINAYAGTAATQAARDALLKVVATAVGDHTALNAETAKIDATIATIVSGGGSNPGKTFPLTVNTDNIAGTSGNDTINAAYDTANKSGTFNSLDVINGGAGTDTLNIEYGQTINGTITSVEKVFYKGVMTADGGTGAALNTVDASKVGGLEQLWFDNVTEGGTGNMAVTNLAAGQAVGFKGKMTGDGTGTGTLDFTATYGTGATTATVAMDGASSVQGDGTGATAGISLTLNGSKLDTVAVSGDGTLTLVAGTGAAPAITTLNITGGSGKSANVNVGTGLGTGVKTVTTAGDTKLNLKGLNTDLSYTGGAGADTLTLSLQGLDSKDSISMGSGTDRLVLAIDGTGSNASETSGVTTVSTTGLTQINRIAVEELQISVQTSTALTTGADTIKLSLDASKFTNAGALVLGDYAGTTAATGTTGAFEVSTGTGADKFVNVVTNLVDTTKLIADGTNNTIQAFAKLGDDGKIASGAGTVNVQVLKDKSVTIAANEGATGASNTGNYNKLVITGDGAAIYTASTATGTGFTSKDVTIDASAQSATGKLTFTGSAAGVEKISLGAGKDVITETSTSGTVATYSTYAKTDVITGFAKGDTLVIANGTGTGDKVDASSELVKFDPTGAVSFEQALTQAAAAAGSAKAAWFNWTDGNTYIVQDTDGTGTAVVDQNSGDLVIKLVGSLTLTTDATLGGITVA